MAREVVDRRTGADADDAPVRDRDPGDRELAKRRIEDVVWFILFVIVAILVVRFFLLLFGARTGVPFVDFWYNISAPLVAPFAGMFGNLETYNLYNGGSRPEVESIVAMLIYGLVAYGVVMLIRIARRDRGV